MVVTGWLIDKSAYARMQAGRAERFDEWNARIERSPVRMSDLLIAATAEKRGLTVLAVGKDFDPIAAITGRPVETLALS